jgi:hypothetical protein
VFQLVGVVLYALKRGGIALFDCHFQQFGGVTHAGGEAVDGAEQFDQARAVAGEGLGLVGVVPNCGVFELAQDFR